MTNTTTLRAALKNLGLQVKLSRRNGIRSKVEVTVVGSIKGQTVVVTGGGETDLEAFQSVTAKLNERIATIG